ncbi:hypothetical protein VRRI112168_15545 [Vreelandella rituensis]
MARVWIALWVRIAAAVTDLVTGSEFLQLQETDAWSGMRATGGREDSNAQASSYYAEDGDVVSAMLHNTWFELQTGKVRHHTTIIDR